MLSPEVVASPVVGRRFDAISHSSPFFGLHSSNVRPRISPASEPTSGNIPPRLPFSSSFFLLTSPARHFKPEAVFFLFILSLFLTFGFSTAARRLLKTSILGPAGWERKDVTGWDRDRKACGGRPPDVSPCVIRISLFIQY